MQPHWITCVFLAVLALPANAQREGFGTPTAGFVFTAGSHSIRPLLGIPGATYLGGAVINDVNAAWIAPGGKWAFVTTATRSGLIQDLSAASPSEASAAGMIDAVDRLAWNRDASAAILYSSSAGRMQRVRFSGGQISVEDPVDITSWGKPTAFAVDPSGRQIAFGIAGAGVYVIHGAQAPALAVSMPLPAAVAFSDSGRLYAVDTEARRIVEFDADLNPMEFAVVDAVEGVPFDPVALAVSGTGKHLMVVDKGTQTVRVYEIATRTLTDTLRLDLAPGHLQRLSANATFLLNRPHGKDWLLVLDATDTPRVYFVPAGEEEAR